MTNPKLQFTIENFRDGFGLVEIVIATAVISIAFFAFSQVGILSVKLLRNEKANLEATLLAQEGMEAVRSLRDQSWNNLTALTPGTRYYPVIQNSEWSLSTTSPGLIDGKFNRYVVLSRVYRNSQDQIAPTGTLDSGTLMATSYATTTLKTIQLITYLTNFQSSLTLPQEQKSIYYEGGITDADFGNFPSKNAGDGDPAQSFTTGASAIQITKVELYLKKATTTPSNIFAELRASPAGAVLGTSNLINSSTITGSGLSWVEFRFDVPVTVAANTVYYIRLRSIPNSTDAGSGSVGYIHWGYQQQSGGPYSGGQAILYIGRLSNPAYAGQVQTNYDFSFRVFSLK